MPVLCKRGNKVDLFGRQIVWLWFKVQGSLLFVTYTIIQGIIGSEMLNVSIR